MASVIGSARTSASSIFSVVTQTAGVVTQTLDALSASIDVLNVKANDMRHDAVFASKLHRARDNSAQIAQAASEQTDLMEEIHRKNYPGIEFNRASVFEAALAQFTAAVKET